MRQMVIPAVFLGAIAAQAALAQQPEKPKAAPPPAEAVAKTEVKKPETRLPRIAILDIDRVWTDSLLGKSYGAQLEKEQSELQSVRTKKQNDLEKLSNEIKALEDDLEKQQKVLSPEALEKKQKDINKKKREVQDFVNDGREEVQKLEQHLQQQQQALQNEFLTKVQPYIEAVSKDKSIDILLHKQAAFLTANREFDVSQDVIVKADDAERAARARAGTPGAAGGTPKPAEKPKPSPPVPAPSPQP
jgi:Skp family chaperone for outer membrane proteins